MSAPSPLHVVHLMASPSFGGPERQMLGLAQHLAPFGVRNTFVTFAERGLSQPFLDEVTRAGFPGITLTHNAPRLGRAVAEIETLLRSLGADLLTCSGYKPDLAGWRAARRAGVPVVAIAHGWTWATWKVRFYEKLDRLVLRWMDAVVCVSEAQAAKVRAARVPEALVTTIPNAVGDEAFAVPDPAYRAKLQQLFPKPPRCIVGAVGRLSPEKGFGVLIEAAAEIMRKMPDVGFVVFGDGPLRESLRRQIESQGLQERFILAGFRPDVRAFLPHLDLAVMPSYTEGLPIALLELCAAGVPVVASAVGGIPEVLRDETCGTLVPPGNVAALTQALFGLLGDDAARRRMGHAGQEQVRSHFAFGPLAARYHELFTRLVARPR